MAGFFDNLPVALASEAESLSRLAYALREDRRMVLVRYGVDDEAGLRARIVSGAVAEHPGYDDYLSAAALLAAHQAVRARLGERLAGGAPAVEAAPRVLGEGGASQAGGGSVSPLVILQAAADVQLAAHFEQASVLCRDALQLFLKNGVVIEVRLAAVDEYAFAWRYGDAVLRIDTAPVARALATFPHHLHDADGQLRADPVTCPGEPPIANLVALVAAVLVDPLLETTGLAER